MTVKRTKERILELYFFEEVFCCPIYLLLEVKPGRLEKWLTRERSVKQTTGHPLHLAGQTIEVRNTQSRQLECLVITFRGSWERSIDNLLVLMHEVHHCVSFLLHDRGLKLTNETEELWAYLQDSIVRRFTDALDKQPTSK